MVHSGNKSYEKHASVYDTPAGLRPRGGEYGRSDLEKNSLNNNMLSLFG
jgi:hypothetical protein